MKIILGYILTFGWIFLMLALTRALKRTKHADDELSRKIVHISVAFTWIAMYFCFGSSFHLVIPPAVMVVLNALSYRYGLFSGMERSDKEKQSPGTVYYALSMTVMALWCRIMPEALPCYGMGLFCMALGDGLAPFFGTIQKGNRRLFGKRSLYGSLSVFVICLLVIIVMVSIFALPIGFGEMLLIALGAVVCELVGVHGFDNLTLPLGVFLLSFAFTL